MITDPEILKKLIQQGSLLPKEEMLEIARKKLPETELIQGDMKQMNLEREFDVIICLFSAINYNPNLTELEKGWNSPF